VWEVSLPGGAPDLPLTALRTLLSAEDVGRTQPAVRFLFGLRRLLGRLFHWDDAPPAQSPSDAPESPTLSRVPAELRARSHPASGSRDGPFVLLYAIDSESVSEIRNATVHAFSVLALQREEGGYRGTWAIHVAPVGAITRFYMALIDPFRRFLIYPAILRHVHRRWVETRGGGAA